MPLQPFHRFTPPDMTLYNLPERSAAQQVGTEVIVSSLDAVRDPLYPFEDIPKSHPDAVEQRNRIRQQKSREVSHYRTVRSRWWEVAHFERVEEDIEKKIVVTAGSEVELTRESKSTLTAKLSFELGYPDIAKITGEIEAGLELTDTGSFKRTESRTIELVQKLRGGYLYFFWQTLEAIRLERRRFGMTSYELVSEVIARSPEVVPVRVQFRGPDDPAATE